MIRNIGRGAASGLGVLVVLGLWLGIGPGQQDALAQRPEPGVYGVFQGDTMYTVLPPDAIRAIREPEFLSGDEADAQMSPDEKVMGLLLPGVARAYSLWHLDAHEIVNDSIVGIAIAATW